MMLSDPGRARSQDAQCARGVRIDSYQYEEAPQDRPHDHCGDRRWNEAGKRPLGAEGLTR